MATPLGSADLAMRTRWSLRDLLLMRLWLEQFRKAMEAACDDEAPPSICWGDSSWTALVRIHDELEALLAHATADAGDESLSVEQQLMLSLHLERNEPGNA